MVVDQTSERVVVNGESHTSLGTCNNKNNSPNSCESLGMGVDVG